MWPLEGFTAAATMPPEFAAVKAAAAFQQCVPKPHGKETASSSAHQAQSCCNTNTKKKSNLKVQAIADAAADNSVTKWSI